MKRTKEHGNWGIYLIDNGKIINRVLFPIGSQGPCCDYSGSMYRQFAEHWVNGKSIEELKEIYPNVKLEI